MHTVFWKSIFSRVAYTLFHYASCFCSCEHLIKWNLIHHRNTFSIIIEKRSMAVGSNVGQNSSNMRARTFVNKSLVTHCSPNGVTRIGYSATLHHISRLPSEVYRCSICNTTFQTSNELAIHTTHHYADYTPPYSPVSLIMIAIFNNFNLTFVLWLT